MKKRDEVLHTWADSRTLYVVLQGEFAMYRAPSGSDEDDDTLVILAPYVECHKYLAGPWLTDWRNTPELPAATPLSLENTFGDRKRNGQHCPRSTPEKNSDIVPNLGALQMQRSAQLAELGPRLRITAPMPLAIIPGLVQTTGGVIIQETDDNHDTKYVAPPPTPTVTPILVYKWFPDVGVPYLSGCREPIYSGPRGSQFQSLQIYATAPNRADEEGFAMDAFTAAAALLGIKAKLICDSEELSQSICVTPPAGLSFAQINWFLYNIWDLDPHDGRLITDDYPGPAPYDPLAGLAGGPHNCGSVTGG